MTVTGRPAATYSPMAHRVAAPRNMEAGRIVTIVCLAALAAVALIGTLHPLSAAVGGTPSAAATISPMAGVGSVWGSSDNAGGINWIDLIAKGTIVLALLFITLRVLSRNGTGVGKRGGKMEVLESRTLAAKASLHLVAIGDRRLVVGLTPSGMVSLAELDAAELETADTADAADGTVVTSAPATPTLASSFLAAAWPLNMVAARIAGVFGGGRVK